MVAQINLFIAGLLIKFTVPIQHFTGPIQHFTGPPTEFTGPIKYSTGSLIKTTGHSIKFTGPLNLPNVTIKFIAVGYLIIIGSSISTIGAVKFPTTPTLVATVGLSSPTPFSFY